MRSKTENQGRSSPECDAARALVAKGITGKLTMLDGKSGKPRIVIDIGRAAQLCVKEEPLRFAPYESRPDAPLSAETDEAAGAAGGERRKIKHYRRPVRRCSAWAA